MSKKVKVVFAQAPNFRKVAASGVWGGVTPGGYIACEFFVDTTVNPDSVDYEVSDKGKQVEVGRHGDNIDGTPKVLRELQTAVLMTPRDAFVAGQWIMQKALEAGYQPTSSAEETVQ